MKTPLTVIMKSPEKTALFIRAVKKGADIQADLFPF